jgi:hypothetical protein
MFTIDNKSFRVDFGPEDTTPDAVANRINASAALAGIRSVPANVSNSQVVVSGTDPGYGPPVATSGNATALGFTISGGAVPRFVYHPGLITTSVSFAPLLRQPPPARDDSAPQSSGGGLFVALAIALGIGGYAYSRRKRSPDNLSSEE